MADTEFKMDFFWQAVGVGIGGTVVMDLWAFTQKKCLNIPSLNYALVGRWLLLMRKGKFFHSTIIQAAEQSGEKTIGWIAHYLIGIIFSVLLILLEGDGWLQDPTLWPALLMGLISVVAPLPAYATLFRFWYSSCENSCSVGCSQTQSGSTCFLWNWPMVKCLTASICTIIGFQPLRLRLPAPGRFIAAWPFEAQRQTLLTVEALDSFVIIAPAFPPEHHVYP